MSDSKIRTRLVPAVLGVALAIAASAGATMASTQTAEPLVITE